MFINLKKDELYWYSVYLLLLDWLRVCETSVKYWIYYGYKVLDEIYCTCIIGQIIT